MKKILVLRGGALGDFIVTLPALHLLRGLWPSAQIEFVGNARAAELGLIAKVIDKVHSQAEARWAQLYHPKPLSPDFKDWLDGFDLIVSLWPDPDGELRRHFAHRGSTFIARDARVSTQPAAAHFCEALRPLGLATQDYTFRFDFSADIRAAAAHRLSGLNDFVALHPGSGSSQKNWPLDRWAKLAARLQRPLLVVTGEAEQNLPRWPENLHVVHAHNWPLPVLGAALTKCACFIGHDSGVSHLATASAAQCVLLFGPTDPAVWAPPGAQVIKRGETLDAISVDEVLAAIATLRPSPASAGPA